MRSEVRAVVRGAVEQVEAEGFPFEDAGIFGEEAEENANEEALKLVAGIAAAFQCVVETAHDLDGRDVDGVLFLELVLLVTGDEREVVDVLMEILQCEFDGRR